MPLVTRDHEAHREKESFLLEHLFLGKVAKLTNLTEACLICQGLGLKTRRCLVMIGILTTSYRSVITRQ
jgi:hypothetical protein